MENKIILNAGIDVPQDFEADVPQVIVDFIKENFFIHAITMWGTYSRSTKERDIKDMEIELKPFRDLVVVFNDNREYTLGFGSYIDYHWVEDFDLEIKLMHKDPTYGYMTRNSWELSGDKALDFIKNNLNLQEHQFEEFKQLKTSLQQIFR